MAWLAGGLDVDETLHALTAAAGDSVAYLKRVRATLAALDEGLAGAIAGVSRDLADIVQLDGDERIACACDHDDNSVSVDAEVTLLVGRKRVEVTVSSTYTNVEGSVADLKFEFYVTPTRVLVFLEESRWKYLQIDAVCFASLLDDAGVTCFEHAGVEHAWPAPTPAAKLSALQAFISGFLAIVHAALVNDEMQSQGVDQGWALRDVRPAIAALTLESCVGGKGYSDDSESE